MFKGETSESNSLHIIHSFYLIKSTYVLSSVYSTKQFPSLFHVCIQRDKTLRVLGCRNLRLVKKMIFQTAQVLKYMDYFSICAHITGLSTKNGKCTGLTQNYSHLHARKCKDWPNTMHENSKQKSKCCNFLGAKSNRKFIN